MGINLTSLYIDYVPEWAYMYFKEYKGIHVDRSSVYYDPNNRVIVYRSNNRHIYVGLGLMENSFNKYGH